MLLNILTMKHFLLFLFLLFCNKNIAQVSGSSAPSRISITKNFYPPMLSIEQNQCILKDEKDNPIKIIKAKQQGYIQFTILNKGQGDAKNLVVTIKKNIPYLTYQSSTAIGNIKSNESQNVKIPIAGEPELQTEIAELEIKISEQNGFDLPAIIHMSFNTLEYKKPDIRVVDSKLYSSDWGSLELGKIVTMKLIVQNIGQGSTDNVAVSCKLPTENVFAVKGSHFTIGEMAPGDHKEINFEFFANAKYESKNIPIDIHLTERFGLYARDTTITVKLNQSLQKNLNVDIQSELPKDKTFTVASFSSDIDVNIPQTNKQNPNLYALIIGNEDYSSYQTGLNNEANVAFAGNDAETFKKYCVTTFGLPNDNLIYIKDATIGKMNQAIEKMVGIIKNTEGLAEVIVYYAGHGLPDETFKDAYLIPVDVTGSDLTQAIKLQSLYSKLTQFPAKKVTVFLDACFTGGGRNQGLIAARSVRIKPKEDALTGNIVVFTASSGEQSSLPYNDKQHGLFTYLFLKKIQETKGKISYNDLYNYLKHEVPLQSIKINSKEQTPSLLNADGVVDSWGDWSFFR